MSLQQILNNTGLCIDIIGVVLIFFNSPKITYNTYIYNDQELKELNKKASRKYRYARIGLLLLVIGFGMQLASNFFG